MTQVATTGKTLPKLSELHHDSEVAFKNDELNLLLNQPVPEKWIVKHPIHKKKITNSKGETVNVPIDYLPIEKVEHLLTSIFQEFRIEVKEVGQLFQSVFCTVRVHYKSPLTGEWSFHDGVGATDVQTAKGASAADLSSINSGAIMRGLPSAKSYAIKDASEHLGKLFGRDLNRNHTVLFGGYYSQEEKSEVKQLDEETKANIETCTTPEELDTLIENNKEFHSNQEFKNLVTKKRSTFKK